MTEREKPQSEKTPYELVKQLETVLSLIGESPERQETITTDTGEQLNVDVYEDKPLPFTSLVRSSIDELLKQSNVTDSYKQHIKELVESHLTNITVRMHAGIWFGSSAQPILEECGIDLKERWSTETLPNGKHRHVLQPPEFGIFETDRNKLKSLEKDIISFRLGGWGSTKPEHIAKMQGWCEEFTEIYHESPPVSHYDGNYNNPVIIRIWTREQY